MKNLLTYLYEKQENQNIVHKSAKIVYEWFVENVGNFYDHSHGMDEKKLIKCELLDDTYIKADCSGYIGAVLSYASLIQKKDVCNLNTRHGSFKLNKKVNISPKKPNKEILKNIIYIKDLDKFENHKYTTDSDLKPGDIIYGTGHCAIVDIVDKNNVKIFDWSRRVENNLTKTSVNIYYPDVLNEGNYYTGYWRLK